MDRKKHIDFSNKRVRLVSDEEKFSLTVDGLTLQIGGNFSSREVYILHCPHSLKDSYLSQWGIESYETEIEDISEVFRLILTLKSGYNFFELDHSTLNEISTSSNPSHTTGS